MIIKGNDSRIHWSGAVSLQEKNGSVKPWRLFYEDLDFFPVSLAEKAEMPAGVRIRFKTDAGQVKLNFSHTPLSTEITLPDGCKLRIPHCLIETAVNGKSVHLIDLPDDGNSALIDGLPDSLKEVEIYLPLNNRFEIHSLEIPDGCVFEFSEDIRPKMVIHGSSITHCIRAECPSQTWPAIAARELGYDLTCLGYGAECKIENSVAMMIRELPADVIVLKLGINTYRQDLSPRTYSSAVIGMIRTIREKHTETPLVLCSPIYSPSYETAISASGQTLVGMREEMKRIHLLFRTRGDRNIFYIDGLKIFGEELNDHLPDKIHPDSEGIKLMGYNFIREFKSLNIDLPHKKMR